MCIKSRIFLLFFLRKKRRIIISIDYTNRRYINRCIPRITLPQYTYQFFFSFQPKTRVHETKANFHRHPIRNRRCNLTPWQEKRTARERERGIWQIVDLSRVCTQPNERFLHSRERRRGGRERERETGRVICDSKRAIHLATCQDSIVGICLWNQSRWTLLLFFLLFGIYSYTHSHIYRTFFSRLLISRISRRSIMRFYCSRVYLRAVPWN